MSAAAGYGAGALGGAPGGALGGGLGEALREERYEAAALRLLLGVLAALGRAAESAPGTREELIALLGAEDA